MIDRFLKLLLASDVPFRRLYRSVTKQKLDLFEFASTSMAEAGAFYGRGRRNCDEDRGVPDCLCRPA